MCVVSQLLALFLCSSEATQYRTTLSTVGDEKFISILGDRQLNLKFSMKSLQKKAFEVKFRFYRCDGMMG